MHFEILIVSDIFERLLCFFRSFRFQSVSKTFTILTWEKYFQWFFSWASSFAHLLKASSLLSGIYSKIIDFIGVDIFSCTKSPYQQVKQAAFYCEYILYYRFHWRRLLIVKQKGVESISLSILFLMTLRRERRTSFSEKFKKAEPDFISLYNGPKFSPCIQNRVYGFDMSFQFLSKGIQPCILCYSYLKTDQFSIAKICSLSNVHTETFLWVFERITKISGFSNETATSSEAWSKKGSMKVEYK